jgi:hypothetical protein
MFAAAEVGRRAGKRDGLARSWRVRLQHALPPACQRQGVAGDRLVTILDHLVKFPRGAGKI